MPASLRARLYPSFTATRTGLSQGGTSSPCAVPRTDANDTTHDQRPYSKPPALHCTKQTKKLDQTDRIATPGRPLLRFAGWYFSLARQCTPSSRCTRLEIDLATLNKRHAPSDAETMSAAAQDGGHGAQAQLPDIHAQCTAESDGPVGLSRRCAALQSIARLTCT